jgi:hypothetical protein
MRRLRFSVFVGLLLPALSLLTMGATDAATVGHQGPKNHCVGVLERITPGRPEARLVSERCFASFTESVAHATSGRVRLKPGQALTDSLLKPASGDTIQTVVIGVDDWSNYWDDGGTYVWETSAGCTPTSGWIVNSMPGGWNDRVGSAKGYSGCSWYGHYEDINRGGSLYVCNCSSMGVMNNQTSSEWWRYCSSC